MFLGIDTSSFMPHGHCILWKPQLLFPIVIADYLIFLAYTSIPVALWIFQKNRPDIPRDTRQILFLFFLFIQLCGITHLISAYNYWNNEYVIEMFFKVATALISVVTAVLLFKLLPQLINLPSPSAHLKLIDELKDLNKDLEKKVEERTKTITEQKKLLETMVQGHAGAILRYEPAYNSDNQIIDFKSSVIYGDAKEEAGLKYDKSIVGDSILTLFPDIVENGHFSNAVAAFDSNEMIIEDPLFNASLNRYFRVINFKKSDMDFLLVYFTDVTQRELAKIDALNNSKLISLGELAGGVAHEINTPLQVISGNARILTRFIEEDNEIGQKCLNTIDNTVYKISGIIDNLKRLSRKDSGMLVNINITEILDKTITLYDQRFKLKSINLIKDYNPDKEIICTISEVSLFQILNNLISNAIDALMGIDEKRELVISLKDDDNVILSVSNNGPLIPAEIVERVFEPLFTTKEVGKGTGLGLSLSKRLAEEMNAVLSLDQNNNRVCFKVTMGV